MEEPADPAADGDGSSTPDAPDGATTPNERPPADDAQQGSPKPVGLYTRETVAAGMEDSADPQAAGVWRPELFLPSATRGMLGERDLDTSETNRMPYDDPGSEQKTSVETPERALQDATFQLEGVNRVIRRGEEEIAERSAKAARLRGEAENLGQEVLRLQRDLEGSPAMTVRLELEINDVTAKIEELNHKADVEDEEIANITKGLTRHREDAEALELKVATLNEELSNRE